MKIVFCNRKYVFLVTSLNLILFLIVLIDLRGQVGSINTIKSFSFRLNLFINPDFM